jgi:hypothetical protein
MKIFTTRQVADQLGVFTWQVRRLFEDGTFPEPQKFGGKRAIPESMVPKIREALKKHGYLKNEQPAEVG